MSEKYSIDKKTVIARIRQLRSDYAGVRGKALFANELGISSSTYNYYEQDRMPPVELLWRICEVTGADIRWLLSGKKNEDGPAKNKPLPKHFLDKISSLLNIDPTSLSALNAFIDLLHDKAKMEHALTDNPTGSLNNKESPEIDIPSKISKFESEQRGLNKQTDLTRNSWLPILGCTAAGMVHFWSETDQKFPNITELHQIIDSHRKDKHRQVQPEDIRSDTTTPNMVKLSIDQVKLVQLSELGPDGICEFIDCPEIYNRYPDAFGLRVDGDSMSPRIQDGDIIILSPGESARDGAAAVVQLADQIGVTCKIIRRTGQKVHLIPTNETFSTTIFDRDKISWALAVLWRVRPA